MIPNSYRVYLVEGSYPSLGGLTSLLEEAASGVSLARSAEEQTSFRIHGRHVAARHTEVVRLSEYFELIDEGALTAGEENKDSFFDGTNRSWGAFRESWDFIRNIYRKGSSPQNAEGLWPRTKRELEELAVSENKILLITGMPGAGKTTLLRRLAFDIASEGLALVVLLRGTRMTFDYKALAGFVEKLQDQLQDAEGERQTIKLVVMVDEAASMVRHLSQIRDYMASQARPTLVIGCERSGDWNYMFRDRPIILNTGDIFELPEAVEPDEREPLIDHLYELGYIFLRGKSFADVISSQYEDSFFSTVYHLVRPSRQPLDEVIRTQYQRLSELSQKAFNIVCLFGQYGLPVNIELLLRVLPCSWDTFKDEVLGGDAAKMIFEETDPLGNLLYSPHTRLTAEKTIRFFLADPERQLENYVEVLEQSTLTNKKEAEIVEKLLIGYLGPNSRHSPFQPEQQYRLFEAACWHTKKRSLIHHWGIVEMERRRFDNAEKLLKDALKVESWGEDSYRNESDQNILTSLGTLYSRWGLDWLKAGTSGSKQLFQQAEECFASARYGDFPNAHAYHAHAYMAFQCGNFATSEAGKLSGYGEAIEILELAKDNLYLDALEPILELETIVWNAIGDDERVTECLESLRDEHGSPRGYFLLAASLFREAAGYDNPERDKTLRLALRKIEKALAHFPGDEHCLQMNARVVGVLLGSYSQEYFQALKTWHSQATTPNASLLYDLGCLSFIFDYYTDAAHRFDELQKGVGAGHRLRTTIRRWYVKGDDEPKSFEGQIVAPLTADAGRIRCDSLRNLRDLIPFRPFACRFQPQVGEPVRFRIGFNFRGPLASHVERR
jgi:tetratricopeptide (TPR) repeat protein